MADSGLLIAALRAVAAPLVLAWWLLGRSGPRRRPAAEAARRGKMPSK